MCAATSKPTGIAYPFMSAARAENTPQNCLSKGVEVVTCEVNEVRGATRMTNGNILKDRWKQNDSPHVRNLQVDDGSVDVSDMDVDTISSFSPGTTPRG